MSLARLAFRNLGRNRLRTVLTIMGVAVAVLTAILLRTSVSAWSLGADRAPKNRLVTRNRVAYELGLPRHYVDEVSRVPGVSLVSWLSWFGGKDPAHPAQSMSTYACDPASFLSVYDGIAVSAADRERWISDRSGALVGSALATRMGWRVGDRVVLSGTVYPGDWEFKIDAIYTQTAPVADPGLFLLHWEYLNAGGPAPMRDRVEYIWSRVADESAAARVGRTIDAIFEEKDVPTRTEDERAFFASMLGMVSAVLRALDVITLSVLCIGALLVRNTMSVAVDERVRELAAMRAMGFATSLLVGAAVLESLFVGSAGALLGASLSYPIVDGLIGGWVERTLAALLPEFRIPPQHVFGAVSAALVVSAVVAVLPVLRVARVPIVDGLRRAT